MTSINNEEIKMIPFDELSPILTPVGLGPWSASKLKVLKKCPLQFFLKNIMKVKPKFPPPVTLTTQVGKAAHQVLEYVVMDVPLSKAMARTKKEYAPLITDAEWEEHVESLEMSFTLFHDRIRAFANKHPVKRIFTEVKMGVTETWEPTGFFSDDVFFRGVIDLIILLENGDALIIDHKTGAPAVTGLKYYTEQLDTYKVLFHYGIEKIKGATAGIHYIRDQKIKQDNFVSADVIEGKLKADLIYSIDNTIDILKNEYGFFKHICGSQCKYCDYAVECKAGDFKQLEKQTIKFFK